jgi:hypothetical protein
MDSLHVRNPNTHMQETTKNYNTRLEIVSAEIHASITCNTAEIVTSFSLSSNTFQYLCVFIQRPISPPFQFSHIKPHTHTCLRAPQSTILCTSMYINYRGVKFGDRKVSTFLLKAFRTMLLKLLKLFIAKCQQFFSHCHKHCDDGGEWTA